MAPLKYFLPVFTIALIIVNLWAKIYLGDILYLWILFGTMLSFILLFISPWYYYKRGLLLFGLLFLSDGIFIFLEDPIFNALMFLVKTATYLALVWIVLNKLKNLNTNLFQKTVFALAVLLNIFLLYSLVKMVPAGEYSLFFEFLFYLYGFSIIICVSAAVSFSNRYTNKASIFFLGAVLSLIFSDLTYFIAFSLGFNEFYMVDRMFNVVGIALLLQFMRVYRTNSVEKSNSHMIE